MRSTFVLIFAAVCVLQVATVLGQNNLRSEFVESSSPIGNGGHVISRSAPGQAIQTRTVIANLPIRGNSTFTNQRAQTPTNVSRPVYAYPTQSAPRTARLTPTQAVAANSQSRFYNTPVRTRSTSFQVPTAMTRVAQNNCNCAPNAGFNTGFQTPAGAPPATFAPGLNGQLQTQANQPFDPALNGTLQYPANGFNGQPNYTNNAFRNWWNPLITGSGAYQPIVRLQNMPPGTYLGQGIIGQPTAYVDGQPIRNLFRYVFP